MFTRHIVALLVTLSLSSSLLNGAEVPKVEPDVVYGDRDGLALALDVYRPESDGNGAAVLFMVSGGRVSNMGAARASEPLIKPYLDEGYVVFAVRHGSSPRYTIPEAVSDVRKAVRFVRHNAVRF